MSIYDTLNPEQKKAVLHDKGPLLILAGAGSGKTRVLTYRIAYLIEHRNVNPWNILAITFTNKAANEMRERVDKIVGAGAENIWVSTFHSTCVRILRRFIDRLGYDRNFTIYDTDDQKTLMRDVCKYLDIDTKRIPEKSILNAISKAKDELISPEEFEKRAGHDYTQRKYAAAYMEYQRRLKASNALDFDDLIFKTVELFMNDKEALTYYQNRFRYIMVDEYQDTNTAQFKLIHLLASGINEYGEREYNICVVGDDDQSIYKFRGANIYNILNFEQAFPNAKVIKLEQNYRSTKNILNAANEVIANNKGRKQKTLWTDNEEGEPVSFTLFESDFEEADRITSEIKRVVESKQASYNDFAILYRTNAQSRIFEEKLVLKNIPYKIIGALNFYARKEIKDILAYLKTIVNGKDDISVKRIINVPRRGIGLATIDKVNDYAVLNDISFYEALVRARQIPGLERTASKIEPFVSLIEGLRSSINSDSYDLTGIIDDILNATGYLKELEEEGTQEAEERIDNIYELKNKLVSYVETAEIPTLNGFLEEVSLVSDIDSMDESKDNIVLMTLHSAKGLEFPYVYICGMEEGTFPGYMAINAENPEEEIEEERRLCYVGITRAQKRLSLSAAKFRMFRGEMHYNKPSRFIHEIPRHLLKITSPDKKTVYKFADDDFSKESGQTSAYHLSQTHYKPFVTPEPKNFGGSNLGTIDYGIGDTVKHVKFGTGIVTNIVAGGKDYEVTVDFPRFGVKKLMASFANLTKVD
ncbi:DNA helicase-2/ATP-dependent DNA helicase PcrA [Herbinix hemicellulosilytica]|uniref:ATP-dependent DNA helicase n=1 Tax=Herbinix hemicellulosilytica TaxID=1564487 RepID=A0A0H5SU38_HERHM|nr:DNA helicase PcrA [Herbinix hemicellulosilytica]RBP60109.1 DNA helicase-2/ATP-dependent DNA helicase PcrA [Herbinix hemicellulosilytica]CRZ33833.1 ATP-dependent DNA helicase PcrA [Herbinix hemicellulosilytica]